MRSSRVFGPLSLVMLAPAFMLSGCVIRDHDRDHERTYREEPAEGYYDREHRRWYHEHAWVVCDERDPHCPR